MEKAGEILKAILDDHLLVHGRKYSRLFTTWKDVVGDPLCYHTRIVELIDGKLLLAFDHPGWIQMFRFQEKSILRKLNASFPELRIKTMRSLVSPETFALTHQDSPGEEQREAGEVQEVPAYIGEIKDEHLRSILKRLYSHVANADREGKTD